ncbi:MAG: hypothetical protein HQM09_23860 [Candidatus Riflebacteria bacterium]|nr:hypothetical protein [Candidatus Riflebacteria bacterium]
MTTYKHSGITGSHKALAGAGFVFALLMVPIGMVYSWLDIMIMYRFCDAVIVGMFKIGLISLIVGSIVGIEKFILMCSECRNVRAWQWARVPGIMVLLVVAWATFAGLLTNKFEFSFEAIITACTHPLAAAQIISRFSGAGFAGYGFFKGQLLQIAWLCEAIGLFAIILSSKTVATTPFCEPCLKWLQAKGEGAFRVNIATNDSSSFTTGFFADAATGNIEIVKPDFYPHIHVSVSECPSCHKMFEITSFVRTMELDQKSASQVVMYTIPTQIIGPEIALPILRKLGKIPAK